MAATFIINADATQSTITGGVGNSYDLYIQQVGGIGWLGFAAVAPSTTPDTITIGQSAYGVANSLPWPLPFGYYVATLVSATDAFLPSVFFSIPATSDEQAVHYQCLQATVAVLQTIGFPAAHNPAGGADIPLQFGSIVAKKLPLERIYTRPDSPLPLPAVIVTPQRTQAPPMAGVTDRDDYTRPCLVTMVMADNEEPTLQINLDVMALWQEKVMHAFHNQRLSAVPAAYLCHVEPAETVIPQAWGRNVLASAVLLKFICREPRGLT